MVEGVGIHYLHGKPRIAAGTLFTDGLETGQLWYVEAKCNAYGSLGLLSCCVLIIWHQTKKNPKQHQIWPSPVLDKTSLSSRRILAFISLPCNVCLPSKRFTDPSDFCGAETNVTTNISKGKGLGFGVLVVLLGYFLSPLYSFVQKWQNWFPTWNTIVYDNKSVDFTAAVPSKMTL